MGIGGVGGVYSHRVVRVDEVGQNKKYFEVETVFRLFLLLNSHLVTSPVPLVAHFFSIFFCHYYIP